ncbi:protein kinase UbiB [Seminavis robusta]|uniref:Protein kinase UbiB n=1 Tax=Seminavis robusta TaxID=568900 RepID=A0A9N8DDP9_9STRA|nr:protein kinase UbiB [Seminavis robusta]|eukprot:Sro47_g027750.1 protein kinase UbiB (613) ;mRNA; f:44357-46529
MMTNQTSVIILDFDSTIAGFQCNSQQPTKLTRSSPFHVPLSAASVVEYAASGTVEPEDNDSVLIEFPPPLTPLQRTTRALEFYKRVLPVLAAYKAKEVELNLRKTLGDATPPEEEEEMWKELDEWGSTRISETISEMRGFYVKSGQVISTRVDLFPEAYTSKLQVLQDGLEPMPFQLVEKVVRQELLDGAPLSELFASFEEEPLGSASIAQVHKATLLDGRTVAVKLQRPNVEPKLLGDVANLKRISKLLADSLPVDYYAVFSELGDALVNELDFLAEAQAMRKIDLAVRHDNDGKSCPNPPITVPLPVGELVSKRVLVMDFIEGAPLNQLSQRMEEKGIKPGSPEAKIAGRRILDGLTAAFGRMIFGAGFIHGDPHPGNIFIGNGGKVSLIDCGQFKALPRPQRVELAQLLLAVAEYQFSKGAPEAERNLANHVRGFGVTFMDGEQENDELACAVALVLFGDTGVPLPGGYSSNELSEDSPIKLIASFPQELVLMGRATVLLKGIAKRLDIPLSLAGRWNDGCLMTVEAASAPTLPLWGKSIVKGSGESTGTEGDEKIRFRQIASLFKDYAKGKGKRLAERSVDKLPTKLRSRLLEYVVERQERRDAENEK